MYFSTKKLTLQTLCSIIQYMSALTHLQTSLFLEKADEFTNPMFNFQRHVCPNLHKNACISRIVSDMSALTYIKICVFLEKTADFTNPMFNYPTHVCSTHLQTSLFLEKADEFTNPMFNFQRHVCPNLHKNACISRI